MRRRSLLVAVVAATLVVVGVVVWMVRPESESPADPRCPIYVAPALARLVGHDEGADPWTVYSHDGARPGGAPTVVLRGSSVSLGGQKSCRLQIKGAPQNPGKGADWRIGHVFKNPAQVRGRTVTARVRMRADSPMEFDSAYIYIWDGTGWATTPIKRVGTDWQTIETTLTLNPNASAFEVWIRLLFDTGTIRPGDGTFYFVADVEGGTS